MQSWLQKVPWDPSVRTGTNSPGFIALAIPHDAGTISVWKQLPPPKRIPACFSWWLPALGLPQGCWQKCGLCGGLPHLGLPGPWITVGGAGGPTLALEHGAEASARRPGWVLCEAAGSKQRTPSSKAPCQQSKPLNPAFAQTRAVPRRDTKAKPLHRLCSPGLQQQKMQQKLDSSSIECLLRLLSYRAEWETFTLAHSLLQVLNTRRRLTTGGQGQQ